MNKLFYISKQLSKTQKKVFEHYVVSRIWHLLNDLDLKIITQQYIARPNGRALTDLYFPQFEIHLEIDEGYHCKQTLKDELREIDIINATNHEIVRIDVNVNRTIQEIHNDIDSFINKIRDKKLSLTNFKPWNINAEQNPQTYIEKGFIDIVDDCAFRTMVDAANCFGNNYKLKGIWKGGTKHGVELDKCIWFPKLYTNAEWNNRIAYDENTIWEKSAIPEKVEAHFNIEINNPIYKRIVFARVKSPLGDVMYRFKGLYELNHSSSNLMEGLIWERTSTRVKTYQI